MNDKVQQMAGRAFNTVYGRIFGGSAKDELKLVSDLKQPTERQLLEQLLLSHPSSEEMAAAFSALQAELRVKQQRIVWIVAIIGISNLALTSLTIYLLLYR